MKNHTITVDTVLHNWLAGTVDGLPYAVKVCDRQSEYGIDGGRIIKLYLFSGKGPEREITTYERGWAKYPSRRHESSVDALIAYCEALPSVDRWNFESGKKS
ncbi:MAG: hypothetical protein IJ649_06795 [Oscillospiraceae bacterium]|nr:hypothetical protein [Oscillospiraceae bacterium]